MLIGNGRRVCGEPWHSGGLGGRVLSSLPFVVGRDHPILYTSELPCSRGRVMCYKHSGLMATWPVCAHTCSSMWSSSGILRATQEEYSLYLLEVLIISWLRSPRTLSEPRQAEIRKECLRLWGVSVSPACCCSLAGKL